MLRQENKKKTTNPMKKLSTKQKKKKKVPMAMPRTVPQVIKLFFKDFDDKNNLFKISDNEYSVCFEFSDVSFAKASYEQMEFIFLKYVEFLNSLSENTRIQVIHTGIPVETTEYKQNFLFDDNEATLNNDNGKKIVDELNSLINSTIGNKKHTYCEKRLIVITTIADSFDEANTVFFQYQLKIEEKFKLFKSSVRRWSIEETLSFLYDTLNDSPYIQEHPNKSILSAFKETDGTIYDFIAPSHEIDFRDSKHIKINDNKYLSVFYVNKYPISISPKFYNSITSIDVGNIIITENIFPTMPGKVMKKIDKIISGMKTERLSKVKKALKNGYDYEFVKDEKLEEKLKSTQELRNALAKKKQKIFTKNILICVTGESLEDIEKIFQKVSEIASESLVSIAPLSWQQLEGILNILPFGINTLQFQRTMTSEATATSTPFNTKTLAHPKSIMYGIDLISNTIVAADRRALINGNGCVLGTSGSGKSMISKVTNIEEVFFRYPLDDVVIIDPQGEYAPIINDLGGQVVEISTTGNTYINPFDLSMEYKDEKNDPIKTKMEYILAFMESIVGTLTGEQKSIIDRCCKFLYEGYLNEETKPSFGQFYKILSGFNEPEAENLALILERYVSGGMDIFSKDTNVKIHNRLVSFDLSNLTASMQTTGYLVVLEHIMNRLASNRNKGKNTWINIDEFHILLANQFSAEYIAKIYKIGRKLGAIPTIITQNIEDVLKSEQGRKILSNSEFALILRQKPLDLSPVCKIFGISDEESEYVKNSPPGQGLLVYDADVIPFRLIIPENYYMFKLNQTSIKERN